ncbi:MAG: hypothetical protein LC794_07420 [Acidobacteria bacterium]|nr:hypothetical protein [Acidobacteriota bacterium]
MPFAVGWSTTRAARGQSLEQRAGKPRPGKPEGSWPNLDEVQREGDPARGRDGGQRTGPPPIPSTLRSPKVPLQPWNGRRVGDQIVRAHARKRVTPPPVLDDQFIQNFFTWALARAPHPDEATFWNDQFRVAYAQGQASLKLAAVALGKTLFESAEYAARVRDDESYVYESVQDVSDARARPVRLDLLEKSGSAERPRERAPRV